MEVVDPAWLKGRRVKADFTIRGLARKLKLSAAYLCDIEHGRRNCTAEIFEAYKAL